MGQTIYTNCLQEKSQPSTEHVASMHLSMIDLQVPKDNLFSYGRLCGAGTQSILGLK